MIRGGLGGSVGRIGGIWIVFAEGLSLGCQGAIDFIGGNMMKAVRHGCLGTIEPHGFGGLEQNMGADYIGINERIRAVDGAINMRFGGKMDDGVNRLICEQAPYQIMIANIALDKAKIILLANRVKVGTIASIGQGIKDNNPAVRIGLEPEVDKIGPDKASAASDKESVGMIGHGSGFSL